MSRSPRQAPVAGSGRRQPQQARSRRRQDQILAAAAELVGEGGYTDLTMTALATRAGVSVGSLYQHFRDREAVLGALAEPRLEALTDQFDRRFAAVQDPDDAREAIRDSITAFADQVRDDPVLREVMRATRDTPALAQVNIADSRRNAAVVAGHLRRVLDADAEIETMAFLVAQLTTTVVLLSDELGTDEADDVLAAFLRLVEHGFPLPD